MEDKEKAVIEQTQSYIYSLIDQTIKIWVVDDELRKRMPAVLIELHIITVRHSRDAVLPEGSENTNPGTDTATYADHVR